MTAQNSFASVNPARSPLRTFTAAAGFGAALVLTACGSGTSHVTASRTSTTGVSSGSCTGVAGAHQAHVIIEKSPSEVMQRCVGFSSPTISATALLSDAHVPLGTQRYSFGTAICQVDGVPAHYSQCLPQGQRYWALFVSHDGAAWTSAAAGISDTSLRPDDWLGLRYDSPRGNPAPPTAATTPAPA